MKPLNSITMQPKLLTIAFIAGLNYQNAQAIDLNGRYSMLGATAQAEEGDFGYQSSIGNTLTADQQGVRLMLEEGDDVNEWSAHLRAVRLHTAGFPPNASHSSQLFRYSDLGGTILDEGDGTTSTVVNYQLDRLYYRQHFTNTTLSLGRQAIDWGSGRFWQPLNIFGSFSPTDLDTDYKPGIDTVTLDYFPSSFSSVTAVYAFAPHNQSTIKDSGALYYRRQVGELSELSLLAGSITGNTAIGGSFESAWEGIGWRIEGINYRLTTNDEQALFWIAGLDYQLDNGTLLSVEYYDNSRGAASEAELAKLFSDELVALGLQQHLTRHLVGIGVSKDIMPLLNGGYTILGSALEDNRGTDAWSLLHQLSLTYSVSNESDLLLSLVLPSGKGLSLTNAPRSEFGHIPTMLTMRLRFYF